MELDHGSMVPAASPHAIDGQAGSTDHVQRAGVAAAERAALLAFGQAIGRFAERSQLRVALVATGGLSHDPGEKNHGVINPEFDRQFLGEMAAGQTDRLAVLFDRGSDVAGRRHHGGT